MKLCYTFFLTFCVAFAKHELYDGYVVYEVYPNDINDIMLVNDVVNDLTLDIWSYANLDQPGQIFVSEPQKEPFENALKDAGITYKVAVDNIRELLELEDQKLNAATTRINRNSSDLTYDTIYTYDQVIDYLQAIVRRFPENAVLLNAGNSFENRPIYYLSISKHSPNPNKGLIFLQSLLHAREWVTLPVTLHAIHKLLVDVTESDMLNDFEWIIMPVANPDGYVWSHTNDRFWRKNRRTGLSPNNTCIGVDLNRNFDIDWARFSSFDVCSNTFHGLRPVSEPETQAISKVMNRFAYPLTMYADMHSHGSMILYGWGNGTLVPNALLLNFLGVQMANAIDRVKWPSKPNYRVGNIADVLRYTLSGGSTDYAQAIGVPYSYIYELPSYLNGTGVNNFLVDPAFIEQAAVETWASIVVAARLIAGTLEGA